MRDCTQGDVIRINKPTYHSFPSSYTEIKEIKKNQELLVVKKQKYGSEACVLKGAAQGSRLS